MAQVLCLPLAAGAQGDAAEFDLLVRGVKAATVSFSATRDGNAYGVTGAVRTTGLAALIRRLRYEGAVTGSISKGRFRPDTYTESADTGRRQSDATLRYTNGVPHIVRYAPVLPPDAGDVDPATMGGTIDPLTALYVVLRPVDQGGACNLSLDLFDGKRASSMQVSAPDVAGNIVTCGGVYTRLQGFTAKDMARQRRFAFVLTLGPAPGGQVQVVEVIAETIYGKVTLKRR